MINTIENGGGSQELLAISNLTTSSASEKIEELANHESILLLEREKVNLYLELYPVLHGRLNATYAACLCKRTVSSSSIFQLEEGKLYSVVLTKFPRN